MRKSEIFAEIINAVSEETEIPVVDILSGSKTTEVVDARAITVILLNECGFYPKQIAELLNKTSACIRHLISTSDARKQNNKMFEINMHNIRNRLENELKINALPP